MGLPVRDWTHFGLCRVDVCAHVWMGTLIGVPCFISFNLDTGSCAKLIQVISLKHWWGAINPEVDSWDARQTVVGGTWKASRWTGYDGAVQGLSVLTEILLVQCECLWLGPGIAVVVIGFDDRDCRPLWMSAFLTCGLLLLPTLNDFLFAFVVWLSLTAYVLQGLSETPKSSPHLSESHLPSGSTQPTHIKLFSMIVKVCSFFWRHSHSRHKSLHVWITGWMPFWMMR